MRKFKIVIVGGGIIGMTTGCAIQEHLSDLIDTITIISDKWTPNTTGDVSAGLIYPYLAGPDTPNDQMERILIESIKYFNRLVQKSNSSEFGVSRLTIFELFSENDKACLPLASDELPFIRQMNSNEIERLFPNKTIHERYKNGNIVETLIAEPSLFLPYLMKKFQSKNGILITKRIDSLKSLKKDYDLIINCTGIQALHLNDLNDNQQMRPARGQVMRVKAPWIRHGILADQWYILPQINCIVLGGTKDLDNFDLKSDPIISEKIWKHCCELQPSLKMATKIGDYVGLRPYRNALRIEMDANDQQIIHNYGHGGSGVTLSWGSALEVIEIIKQLI